MDLILPLSLEGIFTYNLEENAFKSVEVGMRVAAPFRGNSLYTGIVFKKHTKAPELYKTRSIYQILDDYPIVTEEQLKLWQWMSDYYLCTLGQIYQAALPGAFKLQSETLISKRWEVAPKKGNLSEKESLVWEALERASSLSIDEISQLIETKSTLPTLKKMLDESLIQIHEQLIEKYKVKKERYIFIYPELQGKQEKEERWSEIFSRLEKSPRQKEALMFFLSYKAKENKPLRQVEFLKNSGASQATLRALIEKKILHSEALTVDRVIYEDISGPLIELPELTVAQQIAYQKISRCFKITDTVVLHGVVASGKTEIYIQFIQKTIAQGKNVLYLLPEISLTTQLVVRLRKHFGAHMALYHSRLHQNERAELWRKILQGAYPLVIGVRSALFLPLSSLGLLIVDDEHEAGFKQQESLPYYHARDTALIWAKMQGAKSILGSATPSLETYHNAQIGKYAWVDLKERYAISNPPSIELIDLKENYHRKCMHGLFSEDLLSAIEETLREKKQFLLFQNRRGYAPIIQCQSCGFVPECAHCDVSLTYHLSKQILLCHYCGYSQANPHYCFMCGSVALDHKGFGTQQIEEQLKTFFMHVRVSRMDSDAMYKKFAYEKLMADFQAKDIDGLIGTQMLAKVLNFEEVALVGIIRADQLLAYQDFRAEERAYQMLSQLSGRSGRRELTGRVLIQTFQRDHPVLKEVLRQGYESMCVRVLQERKRFFYPPYSKLIEITLSHSNVSKISAASDQLGKLLRVYFGPHLFGPETPTIGRIKGKYLRKILIKLLPEKEALVQGRNYIRKAIKNFHTVKAWRSIRLLVNVDPL